MVGLRLRSNFSQLKAHDERLERLGLLADPDLIFKREGDGFKRLYKISNGQLQPVLEAFNDALWVPQPQSAQH